MKPARLLLCCLLAPVAFAAEITLGSGVVLKEARVVHITEKLVTIVHAGGTVSVPPGELDLEVLARAQMELEAKQAERAKRAAEAAGKADQRSAEAAEKKAEDVRLALAMSAARGNTHTDAPAAPPAETAPVAKKKGAAPAKAAPPRVDPAARVAALKASFPAQSAGTARVFIPKSGQDKKPYIVSSTATNLPDGRRITSETTRTSAQGRIEPFTYDVPATEVWTWYRGMIQTTTLDALPRTLQMIEARLAEDTRKAQVAAGGSSMSVAAQAQHTLAWFDRQLKPYLDQWRALLR